MKYLSWITLGFLLLMMHMIGGTMMRSEGVVFDLPEVAIKDGEITDMVALVMPHGRDTMVFFDDARYMMGDTYQTAKLGEQFAERAYKVRNKTLLVLADRRVEIGEIMKLAAIARTAGLEKILFANKRQEQAE